MYSIEELAYQQTPLGEISLRRRAEPRLDGRILYEVKLGDEFLMSSLFTEAEEQLASLGLALLNENGHKTSLDIVVGGLGLGYTAATVLENRLVNRLHVIDVMQPVIDWHKQELVPMGKTLNQDNRCELVLGDFFAMATSDGEGFSSFEPPIQVHGIFLDIDHSPGHFLNLENRQFYTPASLISMASKIMPGGVFGLWSNELPDESFTQLLREVFSMVETHIVSFPNPYQETDATNSVYLATV